MTEQLNSLALASSLPAGIDDGCNGNYARLRELQDMLVHYKIEEGQRRMANNQVIQDLQAGALWEEIGNQMHSLTSGLASLQDDVAVQLTEISDAVAKVADSAEEARALLEEDMQLEQERRDREADSELSKRAEVLQGMVVEMRAEIVQMEAAATSQIDFSAEQLLQTVDKQMGEALEEGKTNQTELDAQLKETLTLLTAVNNKIQAVSTQAGASRSTLDGLIGTGNEGNKELRRKIRDLEMSSLRSVKWVEDTAEEEHEVAVLRESVQRLRFEIEAEVEKRNEENEEKNKKKPNNSHWLGTGEPTVDAAATLLEEVESQAQMHSLKLIKKTLDRGESSGEQPGKITPSNEKTKLINKAKIVEQQLKQLQIDFRAPAPSTPAGDPCKQLNQALDAARVERTAIKHQVKDAKVDQEILGGTVGTLEQRVDKFEKSLKLAESARALQEKFIELDAQFEGALGEDGLMELCMWLCGQNGFTAPGEEINVSTVLFAYLEDNLKKYRKSVLDFDGFVKIVQRAIHSSVI
eukprot:TRINITY_DN10779_c0_g1_i1.p1 TRINITY_DN10779_c0_g1~~TRINITY_DN10779_c0_g1_i1.p1  ORF type:complete len:524 (+),score=201.86 TRINITY_DN10779_c0_g1_i1:199-1770(+)